MRNFKTNVWDFYRKNGRHDLPWRKTRDPYKILVSEVMLQQTQVARVLQKYPQFIRAFPDTQTLAKAPLKRVLGLWQGMGYNRRAIALKRLAQEVVTHHRGKIPLTIQESERLPGVGPYTARAVQIFAFNEPHGCIETNIRRTYIHHFFPHAKNVSDKKLLPIIEATMDKKNPREWYWALMDYGSTLPKKIKNPNRKSKHYVRQKPFKGSNREVRGRILKTLLNNGPMNEDVLKKHIKQKELTKNLHTLVSEGFLKKQKERYAVM